MKKILSTTIALTIALSTAFTSYYAVNSTLTAEYDSDNSACIINGGFENGSENWGELYYSLGHMRTDRLETENVYAGKYAASIAKGDSNYIYTEFECEENKNYILTFASENAYGTACTVIPPFEFKTILHGADGYAATNGIVNKNLIGGNGWRTNRIEFNSGTNTKLRIAFYNRWNNQNDSRFDEVAIIEKDIGVLVNGGFENGTEGWASKFFGTLRPSMITDDAYSGKHSATVGSGALDYIYNEFKCEKNTDYILQFRHKNTGGSMSYCIAKQFSGQPDIRDNTNAEKIVNLTGIKNSEEWEKTEVLFNSGDNTVLRVVFANSYANMNADNRFDDITVIRDSDNGQIIKNGGFENNDLHWKGIGTAESDASQLTDTYAKNDNYSLKLNGGNYNKIHQIFDCKPNTEYTLSFNYYAIKTNWATKIAIVDAAASSYDNPLTVCKFEIKNEWQSVSVDFYNENAEKLKLGIQSLDGCEVYIDDISIVEKPYTAPAFISDLRGARYICDDADNLVTGWDFESSGNWETDTFIGNGTLCVEESSLAVSGNKVLTFSSQSDEMVDNIFYVNVKPNTDYIFTVWVKGKLKSKTNKTNMTFGIIDPKSGLFLPKNNDSGRTFNGTVLMIPPSWDENWHIVSMDFNSKSAHKIGIAIRGACSQAEFDNMYLFEKSNAKKFVSPELDRTPIAITNNAPQKQYCSVDNNLIENFDFSNNESDFWQTGSIFGNTVTISNTGGGKGNALHYKYKIQNPSMVYYIKWIDVKKNTDYTFSCKYKITSVGEKGFFGLINGSRYLPSPISKWYFNDKTATDNELWKKAAVSFNTGGYDRIGFVVFDGGGSAFIDDIRLFESLNAFDSVDVPVIKSNTQNSVILEPIENYEYSIDGLNYQASNCFNNLTTGKEYMFYQRNSDGKISEPLSYTIALEGDVNGDNHVDSLDMIVLRKILLNIVNVSNYRCADLNNDGEIDIRDMVKLKKLLS